MLRTSDAVAKHAYSRMRLNASHAWAKYAATEVAFVIRECRLGAGYTVLDIGCGSGRHVLELGKNGIQATGVDYLSDAGACLPKSGTHNTGTARHKDHIWSETHQATKTILNLPARERRELPHVPTGHGIPEWRG